ncbi:MAG: PepSY domain-containing protein [Burkholderiales bacterium]|nr:PepSY domain-containing protein [Burkholderiales bacterium]
MKKMTVATLFTATMLLFSFNSAFAGNEGLPADRVIAAIQTAVAANPGLIHEVEVETKQGKLAVEVKIIDAKGQKVKVKVDPETNAVIPAK